MYNNKKYNYNKKVWQAGGQDKYGM